MKDTVKDEKRKIRALRFLHQENEQRIGNKNRELISASDMVNTLIERCNQIALLIENSQKRLAETLAPGGIIAPNSVMQIHHFITEQSTQESYVKEELKDARNRYDELHSELTSLNVERRLLREKIEQKEQETIQMLNSVEYSEVEDLFLARMARGES
ncbi:hypothetical protein A9Q99_08215 [Gammaproteobacteria bacterium 45_16_T64]|nr:hypothetical protein A9Q99_08215 [Gammaproteobacteria bacterium 45_16_T64]